MISRILAIDYGSKRIGLALSDPLRIFAKPYKTIPNTTFEDILLQIQTIVTEQNVGDIVIGIPWKLDGEKSITTDITLDFVSRLQDCLTLPIHTSDERYSSSEANALLKELGYDIKSARQVVDAMAACLILKRFMEHNPHG